MKNMHSALSSQLRRHQVHSPLTFAILVAVALAADPAAAAERVELRETATDPRTYAVSAHLDVAGQLQTSVGNGKAVGMKLNVDANCGYSERRLVGAGRDAEALRSLRHYQKMVAEIHVGEQTSVSQLRPGVRLIVAQGQREGTQLFSPAGPLSYSELELLKMPADSLNVLALLPDTPVEPGDTWKPADWVLQFLTGLEAVEKTALTCKLESVSGGVARVSLQGEIVGASLGAASVVKVSGHYLFDTELKHLTHAEVTHAVKQSVGTVSPGLDALAKVVIERKVSDQPLAIGDKSEIPLDPNPASLLLMFESPEWNVRFYYPRQWHQFHQTPHVTVLRLLDRGNLVAQCDVHAAVTAEPGKHISEEQFQMDIQRSLGKSFQKIMQAKRVSMGDDLYVYRVTVLGETQGVPVQWIYYLVAAPDGRQVVFFFTVEPKLAEVLQTRDLELVGSLEFLPVTRKTPQVIPTSR